MSANQQSAPFDIVGIGVSVWDVVMLVDGLPEEEAVVRAIDRSTGLGGGVAVAMATAGTLGGRVALADSLGQDVLSKSILEALRKASVDISRVEQSAVGSASAASVWVDSKSGSRTIVYSPGVALELQWSDELASMIATSKILHLNGRHLEVSLRAADLAKKHGARVSFDGGAHRYRDEILPLVHKSDILIVAEHFAEAHLRSRNLSSTGMRDPAALARFLISEFDCELAGVTLGERGSHFALRGGEGWHQPAITEGPVLDTTGCGDTFHGAFLWAWARGQTPTRCAKIASVIAAENTKQLGAFGLGGEEARKIACELLDREGR